MAEGMIKEIPMVSVITLVSKKKAARKTRIWIFPKPKGGGGGNNVNDKSCAIISPISVNASS